MTTDHYRLARFIDASARQATLFLTALAALTCIAAVNAINLISEGSVEIRRAGRSSALELHAGLDLRPPAPR
ncbi:MAG: hypothetical protein KDJ25_00975 [Rhodoblastus sp.]|nr:hypothetical protein [Rhodoblastus sp.]